MNNSNTTNDFPLRYNLPEGTQVLVNRIEPDVYEFHLTRLNSEKHNFTWKRTTGELEDGYDQRFNEIEKQAIDLLQDSL